MWNEYRNDFSSNVVFTYFLKGDFVKWVFASVCVNANELCLGVFQLSVGTQWRPQGPTPLPPGVPGPSSFFDTLDATGALTDLTCYKARQNALAAFFAFIGMQQRIFGDPVGPAGVDLAFMSLYVGHLRTQAGLSYQTTVEMIHPPTRLHDLVSMPTMLYDCLVHNFLCFNIPPPHPLSIWCSISTSFWSG